MDKFVVNKHMTIRGESFLPGESFDPNRVAPAKLKQFLRHRLIRPDMSADRNEPVTGDKPT
jgi:hypothetical protein